jgi:hypothetical protein
MTERRKSGSPPEQDRDQRRPPGRTGRGDTLRDTERARQAEEGGEEWHERGDDRGERGETARKDPAACRKCCGACGD